MGKKRYFYFDKVVILGEIAKRRLRVANVDVVNVDFANDDMDKGRVMAKQELGKKRRCASCGMKFYDFNKSKITCPSCQTVFNPEQLLKSRRGRVAKAASAAAPQKDEITEDAMIDDSEDDEADSLGGDEDLAALSAPETNDDDEAGTMLDDNVDEDFIDEIEEDGAAEENDE